MAGDLTGVPLTQANMLSTDNMYSYEDGDWLLERIEHRLEDAQSSISYTFGNRRLVRISNFELIVSAESFEDKDAQLLMDTHVSLQHFYSCSLALDVYLADQINNKRMRSDGEEYRLPLFGTSWIKSGKLTMLTGDPMYVQFAVALSNASNKAIKGFCYTRETFLGVNNVYQKIISWPVEGLNACRPYGTLYHTWRLIESGVKVTKAIMHTAVVMIFIPHHDDEMEMESITLDGLDTKLLRLRKTNGKTWGYAFGFSDCLDNMTRFRQLITVTTKGDTPRLATISDFDDQSRCMYAADIVFNFSGHCTKALLHTIDEISVPGMFMHMYE